MIISRTFFCPTCYANGRPHKGDMFIVYKTSHKILAFKKSHHDMLKGFTPHLFEFDEILEPTKVSVCCGMIGCGIDKGEDHGNEADIGLIGAYFISLPKKQVIALRDKWKNTGYELF